MSEVPHKEGSDRFSYRLSLFAPEQTTPQRPTPGSDVSIERSPLSRLPAQSNVAMHVVTERIFFCVFIQTHLNVFHLFRKNVIRLHVWPSPPCSPSLAFWFGGGSESFTTRARIILSEVSSHKPEWFAVRPSYLCLSVPKLRDPKNEVGCVSYVDENVSAVYKRHVDSIHCALSANALRSA